MNICRICKELPASKYFDDMCSSCYTKKKLKEDNKKMTEYEYESYDWLQKRKSKLLHEVDMIEDIIDKLIQLRKEENKK